MSVPYVVVNCATSLDGCLDAASGPRLVLSHADDLDRVDELRAGCDAILVGANTVRRDNPRLLVRSGARVERRVREGRHAQPLKVTLTRSGNLDPALDFFTTGSSGRMVFVRGDAEVLAARLGDAATVVNLPAGAGLRPLLEALGARGVRRLLVEGGSEVLTAFLAEDLVDELTVAIAPFVVGARDAPRLVCPAVFPFDATRRMPVQHVGQAGDMVVVTYQLH